MSLPDIANELAELDLVVQYLLTDADQHAADTAAHALVAAEQAAKHLRQLAADLKATIASKVEKGTHTFGELQCHVTWVPNRTGWDDEQLAGELRRSVLFDSDGDERPGHEVWDRLTELQPIKGRNIASSKIGSERLARVLQLDSANDVDQWCTVGFNRKVTVEELPDERAAA